MADGMVTVSSLLKCTCLIDLVALPLFYITAVFE